MDMLHRERVLEEKQKVIKDSRHPVKFGYRVQSRSQEKKMEEKKMGEKKMKPIISFFKLLSTLPPPGRKGWSC